MTQLRRTRSSAPPAAPAALLLLASLGCGDPNQGDEPAVAPIEGLTSGATCPSNSHLSYASFGQAFISSFCLRCHSETITTGRQAPLDRNFDRLELIRPLARLIDQQAGAGPLATHSVMPPTAPMPSLEQRQQLAEWLACGAP